MLICRITHKRWSHSLLASGQAGRWNKEGSRVLYAAESIPLAFLENMIRRQGIGFNQDFQIIFIEVPDDMSAVEIPEDELSEGWRNFRDYSLCQQVGQKWYDEGKSVVLKVPSAVLPMSYNYVLNALHPDFKKVKLVQATDLLPDERIEQLLKQYGG